MTLYLAASERVRLRPATLADQPLMMKWRNDPAIAPSFFSPGPPSLEVQQQWFEGLCRKKDESLWIIETGAGVAVGTVGLARIDLQAQRAEFGRFLICPEEQGKGYGTEAARLLLKYAFEYLDLTCVYCEVFASNEAALAVYEKLGFIELGRYQGVTQREVSHDSDWQQALSGRADTAPR